MNPRRLWVVEMLVDGEWLPTTGARLTREDGRIALVEWRADNPSEKFRLAPYVAQVSK